jgi:hypothetical protein
MSQSMRISELVGIERRPTREATLWLLTALMVALGGTILWISFSHLKQDDPRWLYNPWTYAISTPIVLGLLSLLIGVIGNRLIERSMQVAFLASLLVHLLLSVYATKIVIFTKLWPDILNELAQERQILQRFEKQVAKYHSLNTNRTGRRPDYLRYVPTTHQPSESKESIEEALQLDASEKVDLVSPQPKLQKNLTPHMIPRDKPQLAPPRSSELAATLSRSQLTAPKLDKTTAQSIDLSIENSSPEPLKATDAQVERQTQSDVALRNDFATLASPTSPSKAELRRRQADEAPSLSQASKAEKSEKQLAKSAPKRGRAVDIPDAPTVESAPDPKNAVAKETQAQLSRARDPSGSLSAPVDASKLKPSLPKSNPLRSRSERSADLRVPLPTAGDRPNAFQRDTAGGRSGPSAPLAMPLEGIAALASPEFGPPELRDSLSNLATRNAKSDSSSSRLPVLGLPQSPQASARASFSTGVDGQSTSALPRRSAQGQSLLESPAGLTGAGRTMQRSAIGVPSLSGAIALPSGQIIDGRDDSQPSALAASNPLDARTRAEVQSTVAPDVPIGRIARGPQGVPDGLARGLASTPDVEISPAAEPQSIPRQVPGSERQMANNIPVPESASEALEPSSPGDLVANSQEANSTRRSDLTSSAGAAINLALDAPMSVGGLAEMSPLNGAVIPRNNRSVDIAPTEIEIQRFAKQEVGGPLAQGNSIPLPKPAFKQRLDRLKDRSGFEDTFMGPQTELAIEMGLEFLAKRQSKSGAWRLQDFDTKVLIHSDTAATALALLSFQGAGYTHQQYQYADHVGKGLKFLLDNQRRDGDLYRPEDPASDQNAWLYSHAIAALALCEAYGMTQDPALKTPAQKAIDFMVASQDKKRGGWRYRPGNGTDTSVSGWFMMAFKSGQLAGLNVPADTFDRIENYLDDSQVSKAQPHLYRYNPYAADTPEQRHGREPTAVMTSAGLLMRLYFGWGRNQTQMMDGADHLLKHPPAPGTSDATLRDTYYWYYATQVMFHMGGDRWKQWNAKLYPMLIETQVTEGPLAGSWDPYRPTADLWARYGGRLYVTTLNLLSLEVNYRHLPLYEATAK